MGGASRYNNDDGEESKLEQKFNMLAVNLPKSSKHDHGEPVGRGMQSSAMACNLGKNIPNLHQLQLGKDQKVKEHNKRNILRQEG